MDLISAAMACPAVAEVRDVSYSLRRGSVAVVAVTAYALRACPVAVVSVVAKTLRCRSVIPIGRVANTLTGNAVVAVGLSSDDPAVLGMTSRAHQNSHQERTHCKEGTPFDQFDPVH